MKQLTAAVSALRKSRHERRKSVILHSKSDKINVRRVQHKFDGHQDDEYIATAQHAYDADEKSDALNIMYQDRGIIKPPRSEVRIGVGSQNVFWGS